MPCDMPRERLWSWVHGEEDGAQAAEIERHVSACNDCNAAASQMRNLVEDLKAAPSGQSAAQARSWPPQIGPYRIVRPIGEGGMGIVFEAEQQTPRRSVALKVIRGSAWADDYRVRLFRREMQSLARLNHPAIAAIHDAGCTEDGQHYYAMELIDGVTLLDYAAGRLPAEQERAAHPLPDGRGPVGDIRNTSFVIRHSSFVARHSPLPLQRRLELFHRICEAISYAHQRGIVHRDIKPSNILVDGDGQPKVLDFGLARFTENEPGATMATELGRLVGTVPYMSPEQVCGLTDQIDVRTDVYALGLLLFELLTGRLPYDVMHVPLHEAVRIICLQPAPDPREFNRALPADVCTIALKALEKEVGRRYQTSAELADDVHRYLTNYPIVARRAGPVYRLRKFVQRHSVAVSLLSILFLVISGSAVRLKVQADRLERERNAAREEAEKFRELSAVLTEFLSSADPWASRAGSRDTRVVDVLDETGRRIVREVTRPLIAAALRNTLGNTYRRFGEFDNAELHLTFALETRSEHLGDAHIETIESMRSLGETLFEAGDLDRAEPLLRGVLERLRSVRAPPDPLIADALNSVGLVYKTRGRFDDALHHFHDALRMQESLAKRIDDSAQADPDAQREAHDAEARIRNNLAALHRARAAQLRAEGDESTAQEALETARTLYLDALTLRVRWLGPEHPDVAKMHNNYALFLRDLGRLDDAAEHAGQALKILRTQLGEQHVLTTRAMFNLSRIEYRRGRVDEAKALAEAALELQRRLLGPEHAHATQTQSLLDRIAAGEPDAD